MSKTKGEMMISLTMRSGLGRVLTNRIIMRSKSSNPHGDIARLKKNPRLWKIYQENQKKCEEFRKKVERDGIKPIKVSKESLERCRKIEEECRKHSVY